MRGGGGVNRGRMPEPESETEEDVVGRIPEWT
jgi:hypothetical protein